LNLPSISISIVFIEGNPDGCSPCFTNEPDYPDDNVPPGANPIYSWNLVLSSGELPEAYDC